MNSTCSICLENFSDQPDVPPMATRCGHLYCLTCATFHFAEPRASCAVCRTPQELEGLVKLYPNCSSSSSSDAGPSARRARVARRSAGGTRADHAYVGVAAEQILDTFRTLSREGTGFSKSALLLAISRYNFFSFSI